MGKIELRANKSRDVLTYDMITNNDHITAQILAISKNKFLFFAYQFRSWINNIFYNHKIYYLNVRPIKILKDKNEFSISYIESIYIKKIDEICSKIPAIVYIDKNDKKAFIYQIGFEFYNAHKESLIKKNNKEINIIDFIEEKKNILLFKNLIKHQLNIPIEKRYPIIHNISLLSSISNNDIDLTQLLISYGLNVNYFDPKQQHNPLSLAIERKNLSIIYKLIKNGANIHHKPKYSFKLGEIFSPLTSAIKKGDIDIILLLLKNVNNFEDELILNEGDLNNFIKNNPSEKNVLDLLEKLSKFNIKFINSTSDSFYKGLFEYSIEKKFVKATTIIIDNSSTFLIREFIRKVPYEHEILTINSAISNIEQKKKSKILLYLFHFALTKDYTKASLEIISNGLHVNYIYSNGRAPLHIALKNKNKQVILKLIEYGAKIHYKALFHMETGEILSPLTIAIKNGDADIILLLLKNVKNYDDELILHEGDLNNFIKNNPSEKNLLDFLNIIHKYKKTSIHPSVFFDLLMFSTSKSYSKVTKNIVRAHFQPKFLDMFIKQSPTESQMINLIKILKKTHVNSETKKSYNFLFHELFIHSIHKNFINAINEMINMIDLNAPVVLNDGLITRFLMIAADKRNFNLVIKLIENGADIDFTIGNYTFFTLLTCSLFYKLNENQIILLILILLDQSIDINHGIFLKIFDYSIENDYANAFNLLTKKKESFKYDDFDLFLKILFFKNCKILSLIIKDRYITNKLYKSTFNEDTNDNIALHFAHLLDYIKDGNIILKLIENTNNINHRNDLGNTPLHNACIFGNTFLALNLILADADINIENNNKLTPLHLAVINNHFSIAHLLMQKGSDINKIDFIGRTPLHYAADLGNIKNLELLLTGSPNINIKDDDAGNTPIHIATEKNNFDIVSLLIENKAEINEKNNKENTPLHIACINGNIDIALLLLKNNADINSQNIDGDTPLHIACKFADISDNKLVIDKLISMGADLKIKNSEGKYPEELLTSLNE